MKKEIYVGADDYRDLVENNGYYVDKTSLIEEYFKNKAKVTLITRPRRFGKTLNMTMMREFFDITKDSKEIFKGTKIMDTDYAKIINSIPVVFLTFKDCNGANKMKLLYSLMETISEEYYRYDEIIKNSNTVSRIMLDKFNDMIEFFRNLDYNMGMIEFKLDSAIHTLIKVLYEHYGKKKVIVLLDEYDAPFIEAKINEYYDEVRTSLASLFNKTFKGNEYIERAIITGIQQIAQESIFSKFNNSITYTVVDKPYSKRFGLTSKETKDYLEYFGYELNEEVKNYYDGYKFYNEDMYNPMSITTYISNSGKLDSYWVNTSSNQLIKDEIINAMSEFKASFEELIENGNAIVTINFKKTFQEEASAESLWGMLVSAGYITIEESYVDDEYKIRIPNNEVYKEFRRIVSAYTKISERNIKNMFKALLKKDIDKFKEIYEQIVLECTSYYDGAQKENSYHMLMLGMCVYLKDRFKVESNVEKGHGRADILIYPLCEGDLNVVIEFKSKEGTDLQIQANEALNQIKDNKYYTGMKGDILLLGIAHDKKNVKMVHEMMHV